MTPHASAPFLQSVGVQQRARLGVIVIAALIFAGLAAAWRYTPLADYLTADRLRDWADIVRRTPWAPFALVLAYVPAAFVLFPRAVLTLVAVLAFGPLLGFVYSLTGILLSAVVAFYVGRLAPAAWIEHLAGRHYATVRRMLDRHGLLAVFALRIVPTAPHIVVCMLLGALSVATWQFVVGTGLGMLPGVLVATVFGGQVLAGLEEPTSANYWLVGAAVLALLGFTWLARRWIARR